MSPRSLLGVLEGGKTRRREPHPDLRTQHTMNQAITSWMQWDTFEGATDDGRLAGVLKLGWLSGKESLVPQNSGSLTKLNSRMFFQ